MIHNLALAINQLSDRRIQQLVLMSVATAIGVLVLLTVGSQFLLDLMADTGRVWLDWIVQIAGLGGALVLAWLLFPIIITTTIGLFLDRVVDAVEDRHYPDIPDVRSQSVSEVTTSAVRFALIAISLNVLALPFYLIPGANLPIFLSLNGYLLGREYFEQIAARRFSPTEVRLLCQRNRRRYWLAGVVLAAMLLVPLFNLIAPIVGIAFMQHNMHSWRLVPSAASS
ncbi:MAG: EI24 domain-containing protein [Pseudomonadota bacterium]